MTRCVAFLLLTLAATIAVNNRAHSEGAIAEGIAPGGVGKGYAFAIALNKPNSEVARAEALAACRKGPEKVASGAAPNSGQARARARCEVVSSFKNKCVALALDPKDGTPGAGWAAGDTQEEADEQALARCRSVAGDDRRDFCKITNRRCDGTAK